MPHKISYDWDWINHQLEVIGEQLENRDKPAFVTGVPRGGLIPAVLASHKLDIPFIPLESATTLPTKNKAQILVFDDIADSGETLMYLENHNFITATLALRHDSRFTPDYVGEFINDDHWLVFPWEELSAKPIQGYLADK